MCQRQGISANSRSILRPCGFGVEYLERYFVQDAGHITISSGHPSYPATHDIAGTPDVITVTANSNPSVSVSVTGGSGSTFTIVHSDSTTNPLQVYWYAAMSDHLP